MMNNETMENSSAAPKSRNARFVPFFVIIVIAVAIGFAIRHFINLKEILPDQGLLKVYFSDVNATVSGHNLEERLVNKLTSATAVVDAALYHLDSEAIATAFINAHNRNVMVRVFTENSNVEEEAIQRLLRQGIDVRDDGDEDGYMHHKFVVIDNRFVWTGSYNTTYNGAYKNDNNVIWIDSIPVAENFTKEFQTIFASRGEEKLPQKNIPHPQVTLSDGTQILSYFSPGSETISPLLNEINSAQKSIDFMAFSFTHDKIGKAMLDQYENGIKVGGVFDENQISKYSEYHLMKESGMDVKIDETSGTMHHKVIMIDEETVITGSYNFSRNAEIRNSENLLIIKGNKDVARAYIEEYSRLK